MPQNPRTPTYEDASTLTEHVQRLQRVARIESMSRRIAEDRPLKLRRRAAKRRSR